MIKKIKLITFLIFTFLIFQPSVSAASVSIWASASNVTVGNKVTISVNTKDVGGVFNISSSNNSVLSGGVTGEWLDENKTYTYTFTAQSTGTASVTITSVDASTTEVGNENAYTTSKSVTLNIVAKSTSNGGSSTNKGNGTTAEKKEYSSDNSLSSLGVEGYNFTPEFNKDTTEYKMTVDQLVEKINVTAKTNYNKASVSGTGEVNLSSGENTIEVKVTAENGNEKIYKIIVTVEDLHPITVNVGKEDFTIIKKNNDLIEKLEHYEETTIKIDEQDVVAYINHTTKVTLVLLKDKDNKVGYYIYNEKSNTYEKYRYITVQGITLQLLDTNPKLENYKKYSVKIGEQAIDIYKIKKKHKVGLIYGTNTQTGNTSYYVYDQNEGTLSKYYEEELEIYRDEIKKLKNYQKVINKKYSLLQQLLIIQSCLY